MKREFIYLQDILTKNIDKIDTQHLILLLPCFYSLHATPLLQSFKLMNQILNRVCQMDMATIPVRNYMTLFQLTAHNYCQFADTSDKQKMFEKATDAQYEKMKESFDLNDQTKACDTIKQMQDLAKCLEELDWGTAIKDKILLFTQEAIKQIAQSDYHKK